MTSADDVFCFPNVVGPIYPGSAILFRIRPYGDDPDRCLKDTWVLEWRAPATEAPPPKRRFVADWHERNWGEITEQDYENLANVQRGMRSSGWPGARLNPRQESEHPAHASRDRPLSRRNRLASRTMIRGRWLGAAVALALLVAACGGGSSKSSSSTTTTAKKADPAADRALASGAVLTASDAPAGFTATPHTSSGDIPEQLKRDFANCLHVDFTAFDDPPGAVDVNGPDLKNADTNAEIDNEIKIFPSKDTVDKDYTTFQNPDIETCLANLFDAAIKQEVATSGSNGATFGKVTVDNFAVNTVPDRGVGFRITLPITAQGTTEIFYIDLIAVQRGRAEITVSSQSVGTPPDRDTAIALAKKMSDRLGQTAP